MFWLVYLAVVLGWVAWKLFAPSAREVWRYWRGRGPL
jgi:hypothetical protein